jgi:dUTPase
MFDLKLEVKIIDPSIETKLPELANKDEYPDSGYDFFSASDVVIEPGDFKMVSTNLALHQPHITLAGFDENMNVVPYRFAIGLMAAQPSGVALKRQLRPKAGIIDSGYSNEVKILLHNEGTKSQIIYPKEKIAQLIPHLVLTGKIEVVNELSNSTSNRGLHGWGSGRKS